MVPLRAYTGISESGELALQVYSSSDCSTMRLRMVAGLRGAAPIRASVQSCTACRAGHACCATLEADFCRHSISWADEVSTCRGRHADSQEVSSVREGGSLHMARGARGADRGGLALLNHALAGRAGEGQRQQHPRRHKQAHQDAGLRHAPPLAALHRARVVGLGAEGSIQAAACPARSQARQDVGISPAPPLSPLHRVSATTSASAVEPTDLQARKEHGQEA